MSSILYVLMPKSRFSGDIGASRKIVTRFYFYHRLCYPGMNNLVCQVVCPMKQPNAKTLKITRDALMSLGFGPNEARAYCALLAKSPLNGYQVAQLSGIPRAKVYESLERLVARGAAVQVETLDAEPRLYAPTDPLELVDQIAQDYDKSLERARQALETYQNNPQVVEVLWRVTSQTDLVARGQKLVQSARRTLHVALWAEEFDALLKALLSAAERGVRIALVLYSPHVGLAKLQQNCAGAILHSRSKRQAVPVMGRQFVLVADRKRCITGSIFPDRDVEGVFTLNLGLVTNAVDLVNHEIYLERVMTVAGEPLMAVFGPDLEKLDAFDPPPHD
jgi:sugar-specific transcriptional regulator TrmB